MSTINSFLKEVRYAMEKVPFYREQLKTLGVAADQLRDDNYHELLPFTQKRDYRKHFPMGVLAEGYSFKHPMLTKSQSSGTTGERLITLELGMNLLRRAMGCASVQKVIQKAFIKKGRRICRYAAPACSDVECANPNSKMEDRLLRDGTLVLPVYHDLLTTSEAMVDQAIDEIQRYQPDLFYVDPTHFAFLLREFCKRGVDVPQVPVVTSYSAMTSVSNRQIRAAMNRTAVAELLSSSEMGWLAMTCEHGHMHLNDSGFFFEGVPSEHDFAELCVSSIDGGASPHIRYLTGDIVQIQEDKQCACGHSGRVITMEGRESSFLRFAGKAWMSPRQLDQLLGDAPWCDLYQFEQVGEGDFIFKFIVNECYNAGDEGEFIEQFAAQWPTATKVQREKLSYIPTERSGKFQAVKGLINVAN